MGDDQTLARESPIIRKSDEAAKSRDDHTGQVSSLGSPHAGLLQCLWKESES